ncbi:hypothetical protein [Paraflavitalea speifideaquila]|uniref:hypothetical protein n=1 Tax=Paraflavitalea speifideaquila TaxID=3076558 RepID=UPI0028F14E53|nr:hypothetical protein [Paraflavitalea speifideiaquila]
MRAQFPANKFDITGEFRRQQEIINQLAWVTTTVLKDLQTFLEANNFNTLETTDAILTVKGQENIPSNFTRLPTTCTIKYYSPLLAAKSLRRHGKPCPLGIPTLPTHQKKQYSPIPKYPI